MDRRLIAAPLAAAVATAVACGALPPGAEPGAAATPAADKRSALRTVLDAVAKPRRAARLRPDTVDARLAVAADAGAARFALAVFNTGDHRVEVNFSDGHTRDFAVFDAGGREVWRWSRGRIFTQVMQNKPIPAGDSTTYAAEWKQPAPGRYTVVAELRSENHPIRRAAEFVVPTAADAAAAVAEAAPGSAAPGPAAPTAGAP